MWNGNFYFMNWIVPSKTIFKGEKSSQEKTISLMKLIFTDWCGKKSHICWTKYIKIGHSACRGHQLGTSKNKSKFFCECSFFYFAMGLNPIRSNNDNSIKQPDLKSYKNCQFLWKLYILRHCLQTESLALGDLLDPTSYLFFVRAWQHCV